MFKTMVNQFRLRFTVEAVGPLLIRSGHETGLDPTRPDMEFIRTGNRIYLPGSSLKGAIRSWSERLLRTASPDYACDPLDRRQACYQRHAVKDSSSAAERYRYSCRACSLFGSQKLRSRISVADALSVPGTIRTAQRHHVAINRFTGGAQGGALFTPEVVEEGRFLVDIQMNNYALWQAALLLQAIQDLHDGYLTIGAGAGKGYGRVQVVAEPEDGQRFRAEWRDWRYEAPSGWYGREAGDIVRDERLRFERRAGWEAEVNGADGWVLLHSLLPSWERLLESDKVEVIG